MAAGGSPERSGINPWLVGLVGYGLYRRGRRKGRQGSASRTPATVDATQLSVSLFAPDPTSGEQWIRASIDGASRTQDALDLTVRTVGDPAVGIDDIPIVLLPMGTRRHVNAVDVYATGGRLGSLPDWAVTRIGRSLRATQVANGQPCAVPGRIRRGPAGDWTAEVLLPEVFEPAR